MAIKEMYLVEFDHETATTRKLLDRLPDAQFGWKPHERSMSLGDLATHVAHIPEWAAIIMKERGFDMLQAPPNVQPRGSRADVLRMFDDTSKAARATMDASDPEWLAVWSLKRGDQEIFSMPRAGAFRAFVMNHSIHHRGQLSVYLRMLNVPLPAIYGPSADEQE